MESVLPLACGRPDEGAGATFSRFVYPFAYKAKEQSRPSDEALCFVESDMKSDTFKSRKEYFSFETRDVLFTSAKWMEIPKEKWNKTKWANGITVHCRSRELALSMLPPKLVLFEWNNVEHKILQTGFLFVDLYFQNPKEGQPKPELDDLLEINEYFRYYQCPYLTHSEKFGELFQNVPVSYEIGSDIFIGDTQLPDKKAYAERWINLLKIPLRIQSESKEMFFSLISDIKQQDECQTIYADNRTYVWTAAVLEKGIASLLPFCPNDGRRGAHKYGHWIRLLNVDEPKKNPKETHTDTSTFEQEWAKERTYHRWEEAGTWYGFSYHSGAMLTGPLTPSIPVATHFRGMYFDMVVLLFYVRVTLFRFSKKLTKIARSGTNRNQEKKYRELRENFILFSILYRFPLLSNQQQGLEMYALARKYFDIDELYGETKEEIDTAHEREEMERQAQSTERMERLTNFGIPIATGALIASIFGMNADQYPFLKWISLILKNGIPNWLTLNSKSVSFAVLFIIVLIAAAISFCLIRKPLSKKRGKK